MRALATRVARCAATAPTATAPADSLRQKRFSNRLFTRARAQRNAVLELEQASAARRMEMYDGITQTLADKASKDDVVRHGQRVLAVALLDAKAADDKLATAALKLLGRMLNFGKLCRVLPSGVVDEICKTLRRVIVSSQHKNSVAIAVWCLSVQVLFGDNGARPLPEALIVALADLLRTPRFDSDSLPEEVSRSPSKEKRRAQTSNRARASPSIVEATNSYVCVCARPDIEGDRQIRVATNGGDARIVGRVGRASCVVVCRACVVRAS